MGHTVFGALVDNITGAILRSYSGPKNGLYKQGQDGSTIVKTRKPVDGSVSFFNVEDMTLKDRRPFNVSYTVSGMTVRLFGLPDRTQVRVRDDALESDGDDEIEFDVPGIYLIELSHPHYLDETLGVTVG